MEAKKHRLSRRQKLIVWVLALIGVGVMAYPFVGSALNGLKQSEVISGYVSTAASASKLEQDAMLQAAEEYNKMLRESTAVTSEPFSVEAFEAALDGYDDILAVNDVGMMGYIDIPAIDVHLPIYHGTGAYALQHGVGHLETSSFPVGGEGTHAILSAHSGLPQSTLFTHLDELKVGDIFCVTVLSRQVWYQVYSTEVVLPEEVSSLYIQENRDLCTLVTCTPYGINTHRLLVHGERVEAPETEAEPVSTTPVEASEPQETPGTVWAIVGALAVLAVLVLILLLVLRRKRKKEADGK